MGHAALKTPMTAAEFLVWDESQTIKHEFVNGQVFERGRPGETQAMVGAGEAHVTLTGNAFVALRLHLKGTLCRCFFVDMKLRVAAADAYFYPDLMVTCSAADARAPLVKAEPLLLVEVLSPSTEGHDRGDKFAAYRLLPSLREYWLIDPQSRRCDLYRLGADGLWVLYPVETGEDVHLSSVDLVVSAAVLWEDVPAVNPPPSVLSSASLPLVPPANTA